MIDINWLKIIFITLVIQIFLVPILWKDFIPVKELTLKRLRIISIILLGPIFLLLCVMLTPTIDEGGIVVLLCGICVGIQGIILALLYRGKKKTRARKVIQPIAMIITSALMTLIFVVLGLYLLLYQRLQIPGVVLIAIGGCAAIFVAIKTEKFLSKRNEQKKGPSKV